MKPKDHFIIFKEDRVISQTLNILARQQGISKSGYIRSLIRNDLQKRNINYMEEKPIRQKVKV